MRKKYFLLVPIIVMELIVLCYSCHRDQRVSILRKGDCYHDKLSIIKENFHFLFCVKRDGSIYAGFSHVDTSDVLLFKDDRLSYIVKDVESSLELGRFRDVKSGEIYRINYRSYINPVRHAESLIGKLGQSKEQFVVYPDPVESYGHGKIDWGLTLVAVIMRPIGMVGDFVRFVRGCDRESRYAWEYDYSRFPFGSSRKYMVELLGNPTYVDVESGVEYYDQYGLFYVNDVVEGMFSRKMLDYRIICKHSGLKYLGLIKPSESNKVQHESHTPAPETLLSTNKVCVRSVANAYANIGKPSGMSASCVVGIVCGIDTVMSSYYDVRNDALRSIARRRDLPEEDVTALMEYVAATDCVMRVEREAALKNDVLNLLRNQKRQPEGLVDLLLDMVASRQHAPVVIDYSIQHLGAMVGSVSDDPTKARIRETFVAAAKDIDETYSGTALYSLAEMPNKSKPESDELRRLTVAACGESANPIARISAIQLAGERGYRETLPMLRGRT